MQKLNAVGRPACDKSNVTEPAAPPQSNFAIFGTKKNVCESVNINTILWTPGGWGAPQTGVQGAEPPAGVWGQSPQLNGGSGGL